MISKEDILFYWDHTHRTVAPVVGGRPVFSRPGNGYHELSNGNHVLQLGDTPRFEPDGLVLQLSGNNRLTEPFNVGVGDAAWFNSATWNITEVPSIFADRSAYLHENTNTDASRFQTLPFSLSASRKDTFEVIFEQGTAPESQFGVYMTSGGSGFLVRLAYNWETDTLTAPNALNSPVYNREILTESGPNGGRVVRLWAVASPSTTAAAQLYVYPAGLGNNTFSGIVHYVGYYLHGSIGTPTDGITPTDGFHWEGAPKPQPMVVYCRYVQTSPSISNSGILSIDGNLRDDLFRIYNGTPNYTVAGFDSPDGAVTAFIQEDIERGDLVECLVVITALGACRLLFRKNNGPISTAVSAALVSGLADRWTNNEVTLNKYSNFNGHRKFQQVKFVKTSNIQSALDGTADDVLMDEIAGLHLSVDAQRISNVVLP